MCGIAGVFHRSQEANVSTELLTRMSDAIAHRGPDGQGIWQAAGVGIAHRRLSIIDLDAGAQPLGNEDGKVQVVFNGEIYNYRELRKELVSRGHQFRTHSDTEVLVHLYEEFGSRMVQRLRGMFAFAIWDARNESLFLARDRVGQKPLYVFQSDQSVLFASEIKSLLTCREVSREIDLEALDSYLKFGVVPGEQSIFRQIRKVPAAHTISYSRNSWHAVPQPYWRLQFQANDQLSVDGWLDCLSEKFSETVTSHRIADVPIGAFLSGGLDSSAVVGELMSSADQSMQTFSIGFQEEKFSELPQARIIATQFGTTHREEIVTADVLTGLNDLVHFYDEPFADSSAIPTMAVCRVASEYVKVVLSGDGGDECFGGYSRYGHDLQEARIRDMLPAWLRTSLVRFLAASWPKVDWLPRPLRLKTALTNLSLSHSAAYANTISLCRSDLRARLFQPDCLDALKSHHPEQRVIDAFKTGSNDPLDGMLSADVSMLLPDDFLTKVDRASMAYGLEVRPPLVDHEFLELAATVPASLKIRSGEKKWIFKKLCEKTLPEEIVWRKKQGFEIPVDDWLRGPLRNIFEEIVLTPGARLHEYIRLSEIRSLYEAHQKKTGRHGNVLWSLLVLARWMDTYLPASSAQIPAIQASL